MWYIGRGGAHALFGLTNGWIRRKSMKYIGGALKYVFKNFIFIFPFALLPSYFFAAALDLESLELIVRKLLAADSDVAFIAVFNSFSLINGPRWVFGVISFACMAVCMPMLFAFIERNMRIGARSFKGVVRRINYYFLTTLVMLIIALAIYELWALVASGLIYASVILFGGVACLVVAIVIALGMFALLAYIFTRLWLWLPCLHITGYHFMDALVFSSQTIGSNKKRLYVAILLPYLAGMALILAAVGVCGMYEIIVPVFVLIELIYILLFLYFCALMYTAYFDASGEERADLKKRF